MGAPVPLADQVVWQSQPRFAQHVHRAAVVKEAGRPVGRELAEAGGGAPATVPGALHLYVRQPPKRAALDKHSRLPVRAAEKLVGDTQDATTTHRARTCGPHINHDDGLSARRAGPVSGDDLNQRARVARPLGYDSELTSVDEREDVEKAPPASRRADLKFKVRAFRLAHREARDALVGSKRRWDAATDQP